MTAQTPEMLFWRGRHMTLCAEPLRPYLSRLRKRRPSFAFSTTALWRGYVGSWTIEDGMLRLRDIQGWLKRGETEVDATMALAFPWGDEKGLAATWVTGVLRCPEGPLVGYAHRMFASVYAQDRFLTFEAGRLIDEHLVLNPPERIVYWIDPDGSRKCVPRVGDRPREVIDDPLEGHDVSEAHIALGRPPEADDDDDDEYFPLNRSALAFQDRSLRRPKWMPPVNDGA